MTIKAEKAVTPWPVIAIEYLPTLGTKGCNPGNELRIQRAAPNSNRKKEGLYKSSCKSNNYILGQVAS